MFRAITALALASATSQNLAALDPTTPWWERVTITISGDGHPQSCRFESSLKPYNGQECQVQASQAAMARTSTGSKDSLTRITFERRFNPGSQPDANLPTGDTLLGQQVMALAIGTKGTVEGCKIVAASGDMRPEYGCKEASAERFQAGVAGGAKPAATREAFMTILVYGHSEHVV